MKEDVVLEYEVKRLDEKGLELVYRVLNESDRAIYLLTPLTEMRDEGAVAVPEKVYAFLDEEGVLQITKRLWPVPEDVDVYVPEVPLLTEVPAGCYFEEAVTTAVPVRVRYPYQVAGPAHGGEASTMGVGESRGISLSIGYVVEKESIVLLDPILAKQDVGEPAVYGSAVATQIILQTNILSIQMPIQDFNSR